MQHTDRRDFLKLAGMAGVTFTAGLFPRAPGRRAGSDFHFVQLSDTHWGFKGAGQSRRRAHAGEGRRDGERARHTSPTSSSSPATSPTPPRTARSGAQRMQRFKEIVSALTVKDVRFMPGEHDASLDKGEAFKEFFGATHYTFDHKGVHFIALDNVSDPAAQLGDEQLAWLAADLKQRKTGRPHRRADPPPAVRPGAELGLGDAPTAPRRSSC